MLLIQLSALSSPI